MEKLDRLVWAAGFAFRAYGLRIGVRVNSAVMLGPVYQHLPAGATPLASDVVDRLYSLIASEPSRSRSIRRFNLLYGDTHQIARTEQMEDLFEIMESDMDSYIARKARGKVFVHAGAVGWGNRMVVIPGQSQSGKTTLVKALLDVGATYYSDEYAVFDRSGRVQPFPAAIFRASRNQGVLRAIAEYVGPQVSNEALPMGLIVLTRYRVGARWKPRMLSPGRGLLGLLANTATARSQPKRAMEILGRTAHDLVVLSGPRGEAGETALAIREWLLASDASSARANLAS
jgi:hypothetical protein